MSIELIFSAACLFVAVGLLIGGLTGKVYNFLSGGRGTRGVIATVRSLPIRALLSCLGLLFLFISLALAKHAHALPVWGR